MPSVDRHVIVEVELGDNNAEYTYISRIWVICTIGTYEKCQSSMIRVKARFRVHGRRRDKGGNIVLLTKGGLGAIEDWTCLQVRVQSPIPVRNTELFWKTACVKLTLHQVDKMAMP